MNKKNKILVGCLALLLVLSVGYALFSETITINGTATAKGSFDIVGTCQSGVPAELVSGVEYRFDDDGFVEGGYKNDTCSITGNEGSLSVELEYPGAKRYFIVKFTNNGTIPATINTLEVKKYYVCLGGTCDDVDPFDNSGNSTEQQYFNYLKLFTYQLVVVGIQEGDGAITPYDKITQAQAAEFLDANGNYILKPGNSSFVGIRAYFNKNIGDENGGSIELSNEVTYSFPFTQITE